MTHPSPTTASRPAADRADRAKRVERVERSYRERRPGLLQWATRTRRNLADAEDAVQDAYVRVLSNLDALGAIEDLGAWVFTAIRNRIVDLWRRDQRHARAGEVQVAAQTLQEIVSAAGLAPVDEILAEELSDALADAMALLPEEQREVIVAQAIEGTTFRELSLRTGVSIDTLAARKRYAIAKLAKALRGWIAED